MIGHSASRTEGNAGGSLSIVLLSCLALLLVPVTTVHASGPPPVRALILYDTLEPYAWLGELHALQVANLLGHFPMAWTMKPVESYSAGEIESYAVTFYIGDGYSNPLPLEFMSDVMTTERTVCWFKYNLWQIAWNGIGYWDLAFTTRYGFQFAGVDDTGFPEIRYKGESLPKDLTDPDLGATIIMDSGRAEVKATAYRPATETEPEASWPYVVHAGNLWYFADSPFTYVSEEDRYLVFCDLIHDIVGIDHAPSRRALIRIEDVAADASPSSLTSVADYLASENVPFEVATISVFNDPLGVVTGAPMTVRLSQAPNVERALRHMVTRGGQIIAHGYTHQYDSTPNPYNGLTGDDSEFFLSSWNETLNDTEFIGPVPEDSVDWVNGRVDQALAELAACGLSPIAWETPHYVSSALDSVEFGKRFTLSSGRVLYFTASGSDFAGQFFPYVIERDVYGQRILPENLGNVEPVPFYDYPARFPADIVRAAQKNLVVRDGWASAYFHPDLDINYLKEIIDGVKALGYTYTAASTVIAQAGPDKTIIDGDTTTLEGAASNGPTPFHYSWSPATGLSNPSVARPIASPSSTTLYTLTVTDADGGTDRDTVSVMVIPRLIAGAGADKTITPGDSIVLDGSAAGGQPPYSYSWSPTAGLDDPDVTRPAASPSATTAYTLTVTDSGIQTESDTVTVRVVPHELTVTASAAPGTVASEGSTSLSAAATDSGPHDITSWSWSDGGAGGTFSPSANVQAPSYTAPANRTDNNQTVTLTVTAACDGPSPLTDSGTATLTVQPVPHVITVSASAAPNTVASGASTNLSATATDTRPAHAIASWSWSDGGAGGAFSPSAKVREPAYTAPANTTDSDRAITLTVTATCNGPVPLAASGSTVLTVQPIAHALVVSASAAPVTVPSGGSTSLSATAIDTRTVHIVAFWSWSDGGAGGSFSPSANAHSPTYTAPANRTDTDQTVTLTVTATCNGPAPTSAVGSTTVTVRPVAHTLSVAAGAPNPATVASGGVSALSATTTDSRIHEAASWSWSDGGAGGSFSPSANAQNPSYTAPVNHADSDQSIGLTVTAVCGGPEPLSASDTTILTVQPVPHSIAVTAFAVPAAVPSGGSATLSAAVTDSRSAHPIVSWSWSDGGGGGAFSPSPEVASPTYTAPINDSNSDAPVSLAVTVTCGGPEPVSGVGSTTLTVQPLPHTLPVTVSANPTTVASGAATSLTASASDGRGHGIATWSWSDNGAGGEFLPSSAIPDPQYRAPENLTGSDLGIPLTAVATCEGPYMVSGAATVMLAVQSVPPGSGEADAMHPPLSLTWGESANLSITYRNLDAFGWQPGQGYHLEAEDKMDRWGVVSLPLASEVPPGATCTFDFSVMAPPLTTLKYDELATAASPGQPDALSCAWQFSRGDVAWNGGLVSRDVVISRFSDIQPDLGHDASWARFHIEELAGRVPMVVKGYQDGTYRPAIPVARDAMAVYLLRALKLPTAPYQGLFTDVTPSDSWAWAEIEGLARAGVVKGFDDGTYRPTIIVSRDAMAVYVSRGLVGGMQVPDGPSAPSFTDVLPDHWAYNEIEYCVAHGVVQGFEDKTYRPGEAVNRGQMAVYVWRAFVAPIGTPVVLGGPSMTAVDPVSASYQGWSSRTTAPASDPGYAYVVFDGARLEPGLAAGDGSFDVRFELRGLFTCTGAASLTETDLVTARDAARTSGVPYYAVQWDIPAGLPAGAYTLVVSVEHEPGIFQELALQPEFTITP